jgi:hypothetical protein
MCNAAGSQRSRAGLLGKGWFGDGVDEADQLHRGVYFHCMVDGEKDQLPGGFSRNRGSTPSPW